MDPSEMRYLEDDATPMMKTIKGATMGLVSGTIWGTIVATWHDVPRVEKSVALPGLIRTIKMMGNHGVTFAAIGGVYIGVEQLVQHYRMKRDFVNGAVGGFVAGASILGFKGKDYRYFLLVLFFFLMLIHCRGIKHDSVWLGVESSASRNFILFRCILLTFLLLTMKQN